MKRLQKKKIFSIIAVFGVLLMFFLNANIMDASASPYYNAYEYCTSLALY